jgi:D-arginine dehydrogenase
MQPSYGPPEIRAITAASLPLVGDFERAMGRSILRPRPLLWAGSAGHEADVEKLLLDIPGLREASCAEAFRRLPVLRRDEITAAAFDDGAQEVDVDALLAYYARVATDSGAAIATRARVAGVTRVGESWEVVTEALTVVAPVVVNAAGAWADAVGALFGARVRSLVPYRRTVVVAASRTPVDPDWPMVTHASQTCYFRPDGENLLASPIEDLPAEAHDAEPFTIDVETAIERVQELTTLELEPLRAWTGLRTIAPDGIPVVGWDADCVGYYWLTGQGGYGIQTSAALSELVAADILDRTPNLPDDAVDAFDRLGPGRAGLVSDAG